MILNINGRRTMYSARGLLRMVCVRCHLFGAVEQWHVSPCILGNPNQWKAICLNCDCELNELILRYWGIPDGDRRVAEYRAELVAKHGEPRRV